MTQDRPETKESEHLIRFERNFLSAILETTNALIAVLDAQGRILRLNRAIEQLTGFTTLESVGTLFWELFLPPGERPLFSARCVASHSKGFTFEAQSRLRARSGPEYEVLWSGSAIMGDDGDLEFIIVTGIDITALKQAEQEKERLIEDLQAALANVKTLRGLLPMCSSCRKIRDDHGYWQQVEEYIKEHFDADFTHGICPDCARRLYPEFAKHWYPDGGKTES